MASFRAWLQLTRAHTAPLEMLISLMGAALGAGGLLSPALAHFTLLGFLYHLTGYGQNSVEDFVRGYDRRDPHKAHHPLQRGAMTVEEARGGVKVLFAGTLFYALYLSHLRPLPLLLLLLVLISGLIYNVKGKSIHFKFLPIALAHSTLFPFAYFSSGGPVGGETLHIMLLGYGFLILQITYQILIEGDIKDLQVKEASLLKRMGVRLKGGVLKVPLRVQLMGLSLKASSLLLALLIWHLLEDSLSALPLLLLFSSLALLFHFRLLKNGPFDHEGALKDMALEEVSSTFLLLSALSPLYHPTLGPLLALLLVLLSLSYFAIMNRFLWGTSLTPKV